MFYQRHIYFFRNSRSRYSCPRPASIVQNSALNFFSVLFKLTNFLSNFLRRFACSDIWLSIPAVKFAVAIQISVIIHCPPQNSVRLCLSPVHTPKFYPFRRYLERLYKHFKISFRQTFIDFVICRHCQNIYLKALFRAMIHLSFQKIFSANFFAL